MTPTNRIVLAPHTPTWAKDFDLERFILMSSINIEKLAVEHIGSTAVEDLDAKPVIDIMLGAPSLAAIESNLITIKALGYQYKPQFESEIPDRRFFAKPLTPPRRFHLHAVELGCDFWRSHIIFRDALRGSKMLVAEYAKLKHALATKYSSDLVSYTNGKTEFVARVVSSGR